MIEPSNKNEECLITEEEPIPEEYKEHRILNQSNISKNNQGNSKPNSVISLNPQSNNISSINQIQNKNIKNINISNSNNIISENKTNSNSNSNPANKSGKKIINENINKNNNNINININNNFINEKTAPNHNLTNNINNTNFNNNNSMSRVSKAKTTLPNFDTSKFDNYDIEQIRYNLLKEYSYFRIDKDKEFLKRMQFDIYKRQIKEDKINQLLEQKKPKIDEDERIKAFNRLIIDANRRLEAQENLENMKNKLEEDITSGPQKKYSDEEWKEIYNKRFKNYVDNINKKKEENILLNKMKKENIENEEISLCPTRKASQKHIDEAAQRMYDEAKKRKIKMDEKIRRINDYKYEEDEASKYVKKIKSEAYSFVDDDDDLNNMNSIEQGISYNDYYIGGKNYNAGRKGQMRKTKNMAVSEFNNKRFDKRPRTGKSCSNLNNRNNINNNKFTFKNQNDFNGYKNPFLQKNDFNLEEERKNLIQMASMKNLQQNSENKNKNKYKYNYNKESPTSGVSNIVDQFFLRQLDNNN